MTEQTIPWTRDNMRKAGRLFAFAHHYGIEYTEQDFEYIERKVKTDKLHRLISQHKIVTDPKTPEKKYQEFYNKRVKLFFLEKLLDDPDITTNVKKSIEYYVGERRYWTIKNAEASAEKIKKAKKQKKKKPLGYYDLTLHNFFIVRWMETCR